MAGGKRTVQRWHERWDGSPASLEEQSRTGRPRVLSRAQVSRHVRAPILAANRAHRAIRYSELLPRVQAATGQQLSLRSLQRYGKQELGAKQKHTKKRTAAESEYAAACKRRASLLPGELGADSRLQCPLICVTRSLTCVANCRRSPALASSS